MRHQRLHRVAVHADEFAQEADRQHLLSVRFFFHDDLGQDRMGNVCAGLGIEDFVVDTFAGHLREVIERDVARRPRVVETPVRIFLDDYGVVVTLSRISHCLSCSIPVLSVYTLPFRDIAMQHKLLRSKRSY